MEFSTPIIVLMLLCWLLAGVGAAFALGALIRNAERKQAQLMTELDNADSRRAELLNHRNGAN